MSKFQRRQWDPSVPKTTGELNEMMARNNTNDDATNSNRPQIFHLDFPIQYNHNPSTTKLTAMIEREQQKLNVKEQGTLLGGKRHSTRRRNKRTFRRKSLKTRQLFTRRKKRHDTL